MFGDDYVIDYVPNFHDILFLSQVKSSSEDRKLEVNIFGLMFIDIY